MSNVHFTQRPGRFWGRLILERPTAIWAADFRGLNQVGAFSFLNEHTIVWDTTIGRFCSIAHKVTIGPTEHPVDWMSSHMFAYGSGGGPFANSAPELMEILGTERFSPDAARTTIGHDVWIGVNVFIRKGVTIGNGAVIAANAAVTRDVEPYSVVGGTPARVIKRRFPDALCERMERVRWWDYRLDKSKLSGIKYSNPEAALDLIERAIGDGSLEKLNPEILEFKK